MQYHWLHYCQQLKRMIFTKKLPMLVNLAVNGTLMRGLELNSGSAKQVRMRGSGKRSTTLPQCDSPTS